MRVHPRRVALQHRQLRWRIAQGWARGQQATRVRMTRIRQFARRARLDHARELYDRGIAPLIITLGGANKDEYSEGAVGRDYLMSLGIPESAIIAETESRNTEEQAHRIAVIARANNLRRLVVVSDGTHLFRIHEICAANGLNVLTSPRTRVSIGGGAAEAERIAHEILSYTAWRLRLAAESALRRS